MDVPIFILSMFRRDIYTRPWTGRPTQTARPIRLPPGGCGIWGNIRSREV